MDFLQKVHMSSQVIGSQNIHNIKAPKGPFVSPAL